MRGTSSASTPFGRRLTLDEWGELPEDEPGELVDGVLVEEEMPGVVHEVIVAWLISVLRERLRPRGGWALGSEVKLGVAPRRGRKADVVAWLPGHPPLPPRGLVRIPPDVAVEVISPEPSDTRRDRLDKLHDYAVFGVRWYWLVDPQARTLEVLALGNDGSYTRTACASRGTVDPLPDVDDLALDLDALWAEVDEIERAAR